MTGQLPDHAWIDMTLRVKLAGEWIDPPGLAERHTCGERLKHLLTEGDLHLKGNGRELATIDLTVVGCPTCAEATFIAINST